MINLSRIPWFDLKIQPFEIQVNLSGPASHDGKCNIGGDILKGCHTSEDAGSPSYA